LGADQAILLYSKDKSSHNGFFYH